MSKGYDLVTGIKTMPRVLTFWQELNGNTSQLSILPILVGYPNQEGNESGNDKYMVSLLGNTCQGSYHLGILTH